MPNKTIAEGDMTIKTTTSAGPIINIIQMITKQVNREPPHYECKGCNCYHDKDPTCHDDRGHAKDKDHDKVHIQSSHDVHHVEDGDEKKSRASHSRSADPMKEV